MSIDVTPVARPTLTERVAEEIRVLLTRRRMRQSQVARTLGVSEQWVSVRLRGVQPIDLNDLERIAAALQTEPAEIVRAAASTTDRYPVGAHPVDVRSPRAAGTRSRFRERVAA